MPAVVAATNGEWGTAALSTLQLLVKLVAIVFAGVLVLRTRRDKRNLGRPLTQS